MESIKGEVCASPEGRSMKRGDAALFARHRQIIFNLMTFAAVLVIWHLASAAYRSDLLLPSPWKTAKAFLFVIQDMETLKNLLLTLQRVMTGFGIALAAGMSLGFLMGCSRTAMQLLDPLLGTVRQVPIMAWVPLTIVWFGLGDGPTVFLIAMVGIFPILLNTIAGVQSISKDYYNAALTMGAGPWSIFKDVMVPATLPDILTGMRLAVSAGWMSVI